MMTNDPSITARQDPPIESSVPSRLGHQKKSNREVDLDLVNQTKNQIRALVQEIADLAKSDCSVEDFYEGFLTRTTSALASVGGAIWIKEPGDAQLELHYQINLSQSLPAGDEQSLTQHGRLLDRLLGAGQPTLIAPNSGSNSPDEPGNPTDCLLVVGPLTTDQSTIGLVEIFQRPGAGPTTQRGYLRFLTQMCEIASDYLRNQRLRAIRDQQIMWQKLEHFIRTIHQGLDTTQTAYTVANEGRRLVDCDRLSVVLASGRRCAVKAVSGLDSIQRRADQVKSLGALSTSVVKSRTPLWYNGEDSELPPQIESAVQQYVDRSHTRMLAIIPLFRESTEQEEPTKRSVGRPDRATQGIAIGALVVEQLKDRKITPALEKRIEVVAQHSQTALANSISHNAIFLLPLWQRLGSMTALLRGSNLPKTIAATTAAVLLGCFLCLYPYPFELKAKGQLTPEIQHEVFAQVDGILKEILVSDNNDTLVKENQLLARMTNNDLMVEIQNLEGRLNQTKEQIKKLQRARYKQLDTLDDVMLDGELLKSIEAEKSLRRELEIKRAEAEKLDILSPANGRVVNWQVRQSLLRRPVVRGQNLMTIIDPNTRWQLELEMPERRVAHLMNAVRESTQPLDVTFALASHPGHEFNGHLISIDRKLEVYSDDGNAALLRIEFDNRQVDRDLLKSGTRVNAKIKCGSRAIGYVVFRELIETAHTSYLFWF